MKFILTAALTCGTLSTYAQDTIYYVKSAPIVAKVEEINPGKVKYKLWDNQTGPSYVLPRKQISRIGSADGKMIWVNEKQWDKHNDEIKRTEERPVSAVARHYKPNILYVSPIVGATTGTGVGAGYENINKTGKFGLRLFAMVGIDHPSYMVMPSLRIYPFGQRIGSFFVSPGLFAGYGNHILNADSITAAGTKDRYTYMQQDFLTGFFVVAGMNLHLTPNILLSVETGGGISYTDLALGDKSSDAGFGKVEVSFGWRF